MVVLVLITSCHVSLNRNSGPVTAQPTITSTASPNADELPALPATRAANRWNPLAARTRKPSRPEQALAREGDDRTHERHGDESGERRLPAEHLKRPAADNRAGDAERDVTAKSEAAVTHDGRGQDAGDQSNSQPRDHLHPPCSCKNQVELGRAGADVDRARGRHPCHTVVSFMHRLSPRKVEAPRCRQSRGLKGDPRCPTRHCATEVKDRAQVVSDTRGVDQMIGASAPVQRLKEPIERVASERPRVRQASSPGARTYGSARRGCRGSVGIDHGVGAQSMRRMSRSPR